MSGLPRTCAVCSHHDQAGADLIDGVCTFGGGRVQAMRHLAPPSWCPLRRVSPTVPKGEEPSEENVYTATEVRRLLVAAWHQTHSSPLNAESLADSLLRCGTPRRAAPPSAPPEPIDEVVKRLRKAWRYDACLVNGTDLQALLDDHARLRGERR